MQIFRAIGLNFSHLRSFFLGEIYVFCHFSLHLKRSRIQPSVTTILEHQALAMPDEAKIRCAMQRIAKCCIESLRTALTIRGAVPSKLPCFHFCFLNLEGSVLR